METFLLVVILVVLFVRWLVLSGKLSRIDQRIDELSARRTDPELIKRVFALETELKQLRATATTRPEPPPIPVAPPPIVAPKIETIVTATPPIETPAMPPPVARINFC